MTYAVDIVIVNWNAGDALVQCVTSIAENTANLVRRIIIVDNASSDGSIEALPQISGIELVIIRNPENRGFSVACNQGAIRSSSDYLLFLNPDTLLKTNSLAPAVAFISNSQHARIGVVGVRLLDERGRTQRSCARFPTAAALLGQAAGFDRLFPRFFPSHFLRDWDHEDTRPVDQVMGAFLLIRRSLFKEIGGFDERFFVYYEDVDLCLRVHQYGFQVVHLAYAFAVHHGCGTTARIPDTRLFLLWRSRLLYAAKHFSSLGFISAIFATLVAEPMVRVGYALARRQPVEALAVGRAYVRMILSLLPQLGVLFSFLRRYNHPPSGL
ncbi:glycosyltransferase [Pararhodospirillum photometricum]|nr:glycosyltransferase [Pararhodospirillum photometricum]